MSYDLECYLTPSSIPVPNTIEGLTWQIAIYSPTPIDREDMPPAMLNAIGRRTHLVNLHVEGQTTAKTDEALDGLIGELLADHDAVILDLQNETVTSRGGTAPLAKEPPKRKAAPLKMTFLYQCAPEQRCDLRSRYLETLKQVAPKALPRRYGSYEPMPYTFAETGADHFLQDWGAEDWFYFWRGSAPYQWSFQAANNADRPRPGQFMCCSSTIEMSPRILGTKKDKADMMRLFSALSVALDVFYAELAPEGPDDSNSHWHGLPARVPLASCIGRTYAELWPEFASGAQDVSGTHWVRDTVIDGLTIPTAPPELQAPAAPSPMGNPLNSRQCYAQVFPFDLPKRPEHSSRR